MESALTLHRLQFAFTITYHYIFPQLTMGLALLIFYWKSRAWFLKDEQANQCARFWIKIFGLSFVMGVVTGIPMEFQFGTNWARFSKAAGGVIGQTLAMEGVISFFLESTFLGFLVFGEKRISPFLHWLSAGGVFIGSWLSGYFIICTDAWMQHPVGYVMGPNQEIVLSSLSALLFNPWAFWQYIHNMLGSVVTGAVTVSSAGAFYLISAKHTPHAKEFLKTGMLFGLAASALVIFPSGDGQGQMLAKHQPAALAAMEGLFHTESGAPMAVLGQPDVEKQKLDNPLVIPHALSVITYKRWDAEVKGLDTFPRDQWPDNVALLFYSFHIMVGLGTIFLAIHLLGALALWRGFLYRSKVLLWTMLVLLPFPFIANTAGWMTAELGRQPWLIHGLMRTADGYSRNVSYGNTMFTLLGFLGLYGLITILYLFLIQRELEHGPGE